MFLHTPLQKMRYQAKPNSSLVIFLSGFKIHHTWKFWKKWQINKALQDILDELEQNSVPGFLGYEQWSGNPSLIIQYWRDHNALIAYARNKDAGHFPHWVAFNTRLAEDAAIGLWHETYLVQQNDMEGLYRNMRPLGLGRVFSSEALHAGASEN